MRHRVGLRTVLLALVVVVASGCNPKANLQTIQSEGGVFECDVSQSWVEETSAKPWRAFRHQDHPGLVLKFKVGSWAIPARNAKQLRAGLGARYNLRYGGVESVLTYRGNALVMYNHDENEYGGAVHTRNWALAKEWYLDHALVVEAQLRVPPEALNTVEVKKIIEDLDVQIGDARLNVDSAGPGGQVQPTSGS
jgi:hypothetical protein